MTVLDIGGLGLGTLSKDVLNVLRTTSEVRTCFCVCVWVGGGLSFFLKGWVDGGACVPHTCAVAF